MRNPEDNWGQVGFKIRTFETVPDPPNLNPTELQYLMDKHEQNELIPLLKCDQPCYTCPGDPETGVTLEYGRDYCSECWRDLRPEKYLMFYSQSFEEYLETNSAVLGTDASMPNTCKSSCDPGYTTNGNTIEVDGVDLLALDAQLVEARAGGGAAVHQRGSGGAAQQHGGLASAPGSEGVACPHEEDLAHESLSAPGQV